jgi:hypothetical protein
MRGLFLLICCLSFSFLALAHEDHHATKTTHHENLTSQFENAEIDGQSKTWVQWIGSFHLIFLHFPIALINMLAISEILLIWYKQQIFEFSSRFLLISSAILAPITALLGFIYSYSTPYSGLMEIFLFWHMWFGISTAIFSIFLVFIRKKIGLGKPYYIWLVLLLLMVNIAGFFGGEMTFGPTLIFPQFTQ